MEPAARKPCDAPSDLHCAKCKSCHYCGKACQLAQCKWLAADFQDQLLDELMPVKKPKEEPAIV
ncbi:hypothetical protein M885DRAFT_566339 [Pelagophyceae sp. CCMP2097]|nr:hypothetical protein M885DRAFT_566339 [Pelagophyceae sp. CCMP2097]